MVELMTKPELIDNAPAAEYIGTKPHTLEIWRSTGRHKIPYVRVGSRIKYKTSDLDDWLASRTVNADSA
jgi:hypothetical protein